MLKLTSSKTHNRTQPSSETCQITTQCHHGCEEEAVIEEDRTEVAEAEATGATAEANGAKTPTRASLAKVTELTVKTQKHLVRTKEMSSSRCSRT